MSSELETQQSRETSSKETFQQTDKGNEDSDSQNAISSIQHQEEIINENDHPINQNVNNVEDENKQASKTNNTESLQSTEKENEDLVETNEEDYVVGSDEKENLVNRTNLIQRSESPKTKADKAVADKAESNT